MFKCPRRAHASWRRCRLLALLVLGGVVMYSSIAYALHVVSGTYRLPLKALGLEILGLLVAAIALACSEDLVPVAALLFVLSLLAYALTAISIDIDKVAHPWKYERPLGEYQTSFLGLDTVYFHVSNNGEAAVPLMYMVTVPPLAYMLFAVIYMGVVLHMLDRLTVYATILLHVPVLIALQWLMARALDRGYLRVHASSRGGLPSDM